MVKFKLFWCFIADINKMDQNINNGNNYANYSILC